MKVKTRSMRSKARTMKTQEDVVVKGDVYEDQEDCDVLFEVDVREMLVALPR